MEDCFSEYKRQIDTCMSARLGRLRGLVAGQLLSIISNYVTGGKHLRPLLLMMCCEGFGGNPADVVSAGVAVEMYHNWTLIHDDILDHDELRRGKPTGHVIGREAGLKNFHLDTAVAEDYGRSVSILAGDLLQGLAAETMASLAPQFPQVTPWLIAQMSGVLGRGLISGEQLDLEMSHMPFDDVKEGLVLIMTTGKTGALLRFCCMAGTALGLNAIDDSRIADMGRFGNLWGVSFQYQDDLLGIFGDVAKLGKTIGSDIREGKRTLLAVRTLAGLKDNARRRFLELYGKDDVSADDIDEVRALMRQSGAVDAVRRSAERFANDALDILKGLQFSPVVYQRLADMTMDMLHREV